MRSKSSDIFVVVINEIMQTKNHFVFFHILEQLVLSVVV